MIGFALFTMAAVASPVKSGGEPVLQDRSFELMGWFCRDAGCEAIPHRQFLGTVHFVPHQQQVLKEADHLATDWSVTLDCRLSHGRIKSCRVVDVSDFPPAEAAAALKLMQAVKLRSTGAQPRRAIFSLNYETSGCPLWFCTITPPPPPPPSSWDETATRR